MREYDGPSDKMEAGLKYELDDDDEEALPIADDISPFVDSGDP